MKLSYRWLQDYLELPSPTEVANLITAHVAEVEHIDIVAERLHHVVVGEVLEARKHPDAEKLNIGLFDVGETEPRQIVFGGKAVLQPGNKLPIALPGARLPNGITIAERKLRGEPSRGMCCLNSELQILDQADRVEFLPADTKNGMPIVEALNLDDAIIEIDNKTLTHRPDLFCHVGFARELSVILKQPLKLPALLQAEGADRLPFQVTVDAIENCRRYLGLVMDHVVVKPSPAWLQQRLLAIGLRPISNVVDITNYVMYEYGQPLHAFDYAKLAGQHIVVRLAKPGETMQTLDGVEHKLSEHTLVIADEQAPAALAGIMGGLNSEITDQTTTVAIESANFKPSTIRLGAQALAIRTDGSTRHEKNLPLVFPELGMWRAVQLMQELAEAQVASPVIDVRNSDQPRPTIQLDLSYVQRLMGVTISQAEVERTLTALGCNVQTNGEQLQVIPPTHRTDLLIAEELIEEIARIYGYTAIEPQPLVATLVPQTVEPTYLLASKLMHRAAEAGAFEVCNYSFYSQATAKRFGLDASVHTSMLNPMNPDQALLRQSLRPNLVLAAERNLDQGQRNFSLVEYGHVYLDSGEQNYFGLACAGSSPQVYRTAKGLAEQLGLNDAKLQLDQVGKWYVATAEANLTKQVAAPEVVTKMQPIPEFPSIELDISVSFPQMVAWEQVSKTILKAGGALITRLDVFDVYENALGIRMTLQATDRTLTMDEAEQLRHTVIKQLKSTYQAKHRF
jgi:phenylalanyl-tRNA synthetase beta chain